MCCQNGISFLSHDPYNEVLFTGTYHCSSAKLVSKSGDFLSRSLLTYLFGHLAAIIYA